MENLRNMYIFKQMKKRKYAKFQVFLPLMHAYPPPWIAFLVLQKVKENDKKINK